MELCQNVLSAQIEESRIRRIEGSLPYIQSEISYEEFFLNYLITNTPCVIGKFITDNWRCRKEWVTESGQPNFSFIKQNFGESLVPVAHCDKEKYYTHPKSEMTVNNFIDYWKEYRDIGYPSDSNLDYLKDWHFMRSYATYQAYEMPHYFKSDWLNEYYDTDNIDDYRFVYMGPKGSWTPFHADVFRSYSWSANICGKKKWIFYPPGQEDYLKDKYGNLPYDVTSPELMDKTKYPYTDKVSGRIEVIQNEGEIIFVPSGWHHQVLNIEDTISLNHNWLNGCNVDISWNFIKTSLQEVRSEIADCKDSMEENEWTDQCQLILKASCGIDYAGFLKFLRVIALKRTHELENIDSCEKTNSICSLHGYSMNITMHHKFDLLRIRRIINDMLNDKDFGELSSGQMIQQGYELLHILDISLK